MLLLCFAALGGGAMAQEAPARTADRGQPEGQAGAIPRLPKIDAVLWGRVQGNHGTGIAGITIAAWPACADFDPEKLAPPLEEAIQRRERADRWKQLYRVTATTDALGAFRLEGLVAADYHLEVLGDYTAIRTYGKGPVTPGTWVEFVVTAGDLRPVDVRVVHARTPQHQKATIYVEPVDEDHRALLLRQPNGYKGRVGGKAVVLFQGPAARIPLRPGTVLSAGLRWPDRETERIAWNGDHDTVELSFAERNLIVVDVRYPPDLADRVVWIGYLAVDPSAPPLDADRFTKAAEWIEHMGGGDSFELGHGVPAGHYRIGACLGRPQMMRASSGGRQHDPGNGAAIDAFLDVEVVSGVTRVQLDMASRDYSDGVLVTVVNEYIETRNAPYVTLQLESADGKLETVHTRREKISDNKVFLFGFSQDVRDCLDGKTQGSVLVSANLSGISTYATVTAGAPATAEARFARPGFIEFELQGLPPAFDRSLIGFRVFSKLMPSGRPHKPEWSEGRARLGPFPPDAYSVRVLSICVEGYGSMAITELVIAVPTAQTVHQVLDIEPLHHFEFTPPTNPFPGYIGLQHEDGRSGGLAKSRGKLSIFLPAGDYMFLDRASGRAPSDVAVPRDSKLDLSDSAVEDK